MGRGLLKRARGITVEKHMILYRGSLKSCNYGCSYCPFSKHPMSERELARDREQWLSFVEDYRESAERLRLGALMVTPYGEALIHPWYWEGLARISALSETDAVGAQTNLSFSVEEALDLFAAAGGSPGKLRLWATFHPEMTTAAQFTDQCRRLRRAGILLCAGGVGVPENLSLLRELKEALKPEGIYLWVNRQDGLERPYTREEKEGFLEIDPYFARELVSAPAARELCRGRLFVEGNGVLRTCNIAPAAERSRKPQEKKYCFLPEHIPEPVCRRKYCSCYLAYGGRSFFLNQILFGPYPLFRIPRRPEAVFLDIQGTLIPGGGGRGGGNRKEAGISPEVLTGLDILVREGASLFFATTMPYEEAVRRCRRIRHLFRGGIFAGGAYICLEEKKSGEDGDAGGHKREFWYPLEESWFSGLEQAGKRLRFRMLRCRKQGILCKVTLLRPAQGLWTKQEAEELIRSLPSACREKLRYIVEENCLHILSAEASKAGGVKMLCSWMGISPKDAAAAGDSPEDREMMEMCGARAAEYGMQERV